MLLQNGHSYAFGMRASASTQYAKTTDRLVPLGFGTCNVIKTNKVPDAQGMDTFYLVGKYYGPGRDLALPPGVTWGRDVTPVAYPPVPGVTPIARPMVFGDEAPEKKDNTKGLAVAAGLIAARIAAVVLIAKMFRPK